MAQASGYAVLPMSISFSDINAELSKQLVGPAQKAAKQAGTAIEKGVAGGAEAAAKKVEGAQYRVKKSTEELATAESKLTESKLKSEAANKAVETAARKRADAEGQGIDAVEKAEQDLLKKRAQAEKAARDLVTAESGVEKAMSESSKATKSLADRQDELEKATSEGEQTNKKFGISLRDMGDEAGNTGGIFEGLGGKIGGALKGLAIGGVAAAGAAAAGLVKVGTDFDDAFDTIRIGTGASGEAFEGLKESAKSVAEVVPAMEGGFGQISSTLADLNTRLGLTGEPLETMTSQFVQLSNMGVDADINDVSQALSGFGVEAADAPAALDELFQISQATGLTITELSNSAVKAGPALRGFGFGLGESAALAGQLDKAGLDADKTMASMTRALTEFAAEGRDAPEALQETVDQIDSFVASGNDAAAMDLAAGLFGTRGASQFVDAVKTGTLSVEDLVGATGATSDTIMGVAEETRSFGESWQLFKQKSMDAIQPVATALFDKLAPALEQASGWIFDELIPAMSDLWEKIQPLVEQGFAVLSDVLDDVWRVIADYLVPAFQDAMRWMKENEDLLKSVAVGAGVLTGALTLMNVQQKIMMAGGLVKWMKTWTSVTKIQAVAQRILNTVMKANPIGLVVTAVAALAAGLTYFFTKTETGQEIWEKFTDFLKSAWESVSAKFSEIWSSITGIFDSFGSKIGELSSWWSDTTSSMGAAWQGFKDHLVGIYENIRSAVFDAWNSYVARVQENWALVTGALSSAWSGTRDTFVSVYENIRSSVFDAFNSAVQLAQDKFSQVTTALSNSWTWVKDQFSSVWDWIRDNVFAKFSSTIDLMRSGAETAMDGIGKAFDWLREKTSKPVNFVIREVYMGGIRKAWGAVANLVGLDDLPEVKEIGGFAQGTARVPGARTRHDNMHMVDPRTGWGISLRGDEGVLVPEAVDGLGEKTVNDLNSIGLREGGRGVARYMEHLGGFADGGFIRRQTPFFGGAVSPVQRSQETFVERFFPNIFTLTSATRYSDSGLHSQGLATDWQDNGAQRPTPNSKGLARAIATNFPNTAELIHWPNDGWPNISNGQPKDFGPATNADHQNHVHWGTRGPVQFNGDDIVLSDIPGGGVWESITSMVKKLWDGVIGKVPSIPGADKMGKMGQLPGAWLKTVAGAAWDHIKGLADKLMPSGGSGGGGGEQWRGLASQALKRMGYGDEYLDAMVQQIGIESTGDPNVVNRWDSNWLKGTPSGGLLQVIEPTYRDVRNKYPSAFEGLPDDRMHPLTNLTAGVGAVKRDWGGPGGRWPTVDGYHNGGLAPAGQGVLHKTALEPEMVLNPKMTEAFIDWMRATPQGESMQVVAKELRTAFDGGDWGYGELAHVLRNEVWAKAIVDGAATLGVISRDTDFMAANAELQQTAADAGRGFLEAQATSLLDVVGLGGLVSMGSSLWDEHGDQAVSTAHSLFGATQNPDTVATASFMGQRVTLEFNAESLDDVVRIGDLKAQADRIDGLEVQLNTKRRPPAGMVTRGGAM